MNHQRFKFYKHSTEYYKSLYNTVTELEDNDLKPVLTHFDWSRFDTLDKLRLTSTTDCRRHYNICISHKTKRIPLST